VLLMGRVSPVVSAAASVLERTAMGIMSVVGVGIFAGFAVSSDMLPGAWQGVFRGIAITAGVVLFLTLLFLLRTGRYFGPIIERIYARTQWRWAGGRTVRAISAVEDLFLKLARTDAHRLRMLVLLSIACYWLMAFEVLLVFWAIGQPISLWIGTIVETFTRSASVAGGAIPGNLGALEASNVAVVKALGLAGGGTLALFRRFRSLRSIGSRRRSPPRSSDSCRCRRRFRIGFFSLGCLVPIIRSRERRLRPTRRWRRSRARISSTFTANISARTTRRLSSSETLVRRRPSRR